MFLSKIWFVLVGLAAGVATTAAFVAPRSADRKILELEGQRLDRAQYAAEQMLKTDAHQWIDRVAKLSRDAVLAEALDSATKGAGEARMINETVKGRLRALVPDLAGVGIETLGAVDGRGRMVARLGERENDYGESLAGLEVIAEALHGYLSDDVWGSGGRLQRVAAVPVVSKARDRIVGAIYLGAETGKRLADLWKQNLGVEIAILLRGQVRTSTVPEPILGNLPELVQQHAAEIAEAKRTRPIPLSAGSERMLAVAAPFVGQAGSQGGTYVLIGKMSPAADPLALLSSTTADDLKWNNFPWFGLAGGLLVALAVGIFLQRHEMERPLGRLRAEVQRLARGELQKLDDTAYSGKFGGIARDVNAAMERFTLAAPHKSEMAKKDLDAILGAPPAPGEPASVFDLPQSHFGGMAPASPFAAPPSVTMAPSSLAPAHTSAPSLLSGGGGAASPPFLGGAPAGGGGLPPGLRPPEDRRPASTLGATPERRLASPNLSSSSGKAPPLPPTPPKAAPSFAAAPVSGLSLGLELETGTGASATGLNESGNGDASGQLGEGDPEEAHFKTVFAEYVATREKCGEAVGSLTLEKFRTKLEANKQQLVAKYGCRTARFSVYVKDGKAAIKATPVR